MTAPLRTPGRSETPRRPPTDYALDAAFVAALAVIGLLAVWPIYADAWLGVVAGVAVAVAGGIAVVGTRRRWRWWWTALSVAAAYLVLGVPLAIPSALAEPASLPAAVLQIVTAPLTGWKNLLTLDLPLGTYQATLAPTLLVFLVVPVVSLSLAWRAGRGWVAAVPVALVLPVFGVLFGSSAVRGVLQLGPVAVTGSVELATGIAALLVALAWYVWRAKAERSLALRLGQRAHGARSRRSGRTAAGRWIIAGTMAVIALLVALVAAPLAVSGSTRDVLRTGVDPELRLRTALSPLTTYRQYFDDARHDEVLFRVSTDRPAERVRIATLSFYDGLVARVIDPAGSPDDQSTAFTRVPAPVTTGAETVLSDIRIEGYRGAWVPVVGDLTGVVFTGQDRSALADGFFYNGGAQMAVELADPGLVSGVAYEQTARVEGAAPALGSLQAPDTGGRLDDAVVPESVTEWITAQEAPAGGAGLAILIDRLRARGYLSHSLTVDAASTPRWVADLAGYSFEPSRAGHSTDRIDELFTALLQRQRDVGGTDDAALVAAPGDDEQFAVAAALLADRLGFPARVVVGARLAAPAGDPGLAACDAGECRGHDISAWIEVQDASGRWVTVDTTPQYENAISPDVDQLSDPQIPTRVEPEQARIVPPPDAAPADGGANEPDDTDSGVDLAPLWAGLRIAGVALLVALVLVGPFLAVVLAKTLRRRSRRATPDPGDRVVAGWDEYVDAAVDRGHPLPATQTRQELARLYDPATAGAATALATWADRSVFGPGVATDDDGARFWELVDEERRRMLGELRGWRRLRARLSVRSLRRSLGALLPATRPARAVRANGRTATTGPATADEGHEEER